MVVVHCQQRGSSLISAQIGSRRALVDLQAHPAAAKADGEELNVRCKFNAVIETRSLPLVPGSVVAPTTAICFRYVVARRARHQIGKKAHDVT